MHYVYILDLSNDQFYVGSTSNLKRRFAQHISGQTVTTTRLKPKQLVFYAAFNTSNKALMFELYLKTSSGFAFRNKHLL